MKLINRTANVLGIGGVPAVPGQVADVPDAAFARCNTPIVRGMIAKGQIEIVEGPKAEKPRGRAPKASKAPATPTAPATDEGEGEAVTDDDLDAALAGMTEPHTEG